MPVRTKPDQQKLKRFSRYVTGLCLVVKLLYFLLLLFCTSFSFLAFANGIAAVVSGSTTCHVDYKPYRTIQFPSISTKGTRKRQHRTRMIQRERIWESYTCWHSTGDWRSVPCSVSFFPVAIFYAFLAFQPTQHIGCYSWLIFFLYKFSHHLLVLVFNFTASPVLL